MHILRSDQTDEAMMDFQNRLQSMEAYDQPLVGQPVSLLRNPDRLYPFWFSR